MQIDRLIQIVFLLLRHENITAKQLAEELCVSTRTIYRDINILSIAGIPITSQKGYGGGLSLLQGFSLDKSYFTQEEQKNIIQALQILKSSNYPNADKSLNKIAGLFSHNLHSEWLEIDFSYWGSPEKERNNITVLERAIINKYVITFTYFNAELTITNQIVEPLKLVFKSHAWYLAAYSKRKNDIRTFKMSRIRDLQITDQLFDRELPKDFSITPVYKEEYQEFTLRFRDCSWELVERKEQEQLARKAIPDVLFRLVDFMQDKVEWMGTATELLAAMGETETVPTVITKWLNKYRTTFLSENCIRCQYSRNPEYKLQCGNKGFVFISSECPNPISIVAISPGIEIE